jgi:hypothetical protein
MEDRAKADGCTGVGRYRLVSDEVTCEARIVGPTGLSISEIRSIV